MSDLLGFDAGSGADCATAPSEAVMKQLRQPTVTERLQMKRDALAADLAQTDEALAALKANPEIERVFNLVQRASGRIGY